MTYHSAGRKSPPCHAGGWVGGWVGGGRVRGLATPENDILIYSTLVELGFPANWITKSELLTCLYEIVADTELN